MAKQFSYRQGGHDVSVWAETEEETVEEAKDELADRDFDLDEDEIRDNIRVIPSPRRIKSSAEDVLMDKRRRGGMEAAEVVEDGMDVGLGTGSTTAWAIAKIGWKIDEGTLTNVRGVATSLQSHELAKEVGIPLINVDEVTELDVAIDGADQWDPENPHVVKGGGASHAREKLIDSMAEKLVIATDDQKRSTPLSYPVPLSILPESREVVKEWIREQGGDPSVRYAEKKDGPLFTANGNLIVDCDFGDIENPEERATELARIPGAQEHGLFVNMVDEVVYGTDDDVKTVRF
ncbi:ribose 5-phosphate isomerase A [Haladaptatus sp. R4]|uniref:ribose 5-phosphate isomerase A n=1 Tax=Haladaptatus sp. R4 TaxID=1679489 RepID=UPI0007B4A115|nr:ribose 5-phosphate isomerase A [Haladaptatus sp. R4]KZN22684.1 ribose 5-phosphate isomerase A [Haladaptatus sp. R4]